jgi:hypothetical protein
MMLFFKEIEGIVDTLQGDAGESCQLFWTGRVAIFQVEFKDVEANFAALLFHREYLLDMYVRSSYISCD